MPISAGPGTSPSTNYELSAEVQFLEAVQFEGDLQEDGNEDKLEAIKDYAILYVAAIGGSGAARGWPRASAP